MGRFARVTEVPAKPFDGATSTVVRLAQDVRSPITTREYRAGQVVEAQVSRELSGYLHAEMVFGGRRVSLGRTGIVGAAWVRVREEDDACMSGVSRVECVSCQLDEIEWREEA